MGVDTTFTIGVGFKIPQEAIDRLVKIAEENGEETYRLEVLESFFSGRDGVRLIAVGSAYTGEVDFIASLDRLTESFESYNMPGGAWGLTRPVIRLEERRALENVAFNLDVEKMPEISQFVGVYWW